MATRMYFGNGNSSLATTNKGGWSSTTSSVLKGLTSGPFGAATTIPISESSNTANYKPKLGQWTSPPLQKAYSFSASDTFSISIGTLQSSTSAFDTTCLYIWVTSGENDTNRGAIYTLTAGGNEWPTSAASSYRGDVALTSSVSAQVGDRIVVEVGYNANDTSTATYTGTMNYGNTGTTDLNAADGDTAVTTRPGWIEFSPDNLFGKLNSVKANIKKTTVQPGWYSPSWGYRVPVTVQFTQVNATLTGFPVYLDLSLLPAGFHTNVNQTDGRDIRITTADGVTEVPREVVYYDAANDKGEVHFKADLSNTVNTLFYVYYGNASATDYAKTATYGTGNVWTTYSAVYHMQQDPSTGGAPILDSTNNNLHAQSYGAMPAGALVDGKLGKALEFNGTSQYLTAPVSAFFEPTNAATMEAWIYPKNVPTNGVYRDVICHSNTENYVLDTHNQTRSTFDRVTDGWTTVEYTTTPLTQNNWFYVVGKYNNTTNTVYQDGLGIFSTFTARNINITASKLFYIAARENPDRYFQGYIDEVRFSTTAHADEWIQTQSHNQKTPSTFYVISAQETSSAYFSKSNIRTTNTQANSAKSNVVVWTYNITNSNSAIANIAGPPGSWIKANIGAYVQPSTSQPTSAKANIRVNDNVVANSPKSSIVVKDNIGANSAKANLYDIHTQDNSTKANIVSTVAQPNSAKADLYIIVSSNNSVKANIVTTSTVDNSVKARIPGTAQCSSKASIVVTMLNGQYSPNLADSYGYYDNAGYYTYTDYPFAGQSFTGNGGVLKNVVFKLSSYFYSGLTGSMYAKVYSHSGVYGTSSVGNAELAISDGIAANTTTGLAKSFTFTFSGSNKIKLENGTYYVIGLYYGNGDFSYSVIIYLDNTSPTHSGNATELTAPSTWRAFSDSDIYFQVYTDNDVQSTKANIVSTVSVGNSVKASIHETHTQDNSAKADILVVFSVNNSSKSSVVVTSVNNNNVRSNLLSSTSKENQVKSSISSSNSNAVYIKANILKIDQLVNNNAKSSIVVTNSFNQSAKSSIVSSTSLNNFAQVNIVATSTIDNVSKSSIVRTEQVNNNATSSIVATTTQINSSKASISSPVSADSSVIANILSTYLKNTYSIASILSVSQYATYIKANILRINEQVENSSKASIVVTSSYDSSVKIDIKSTITVATSVRSNLLSILSWDNSSKAYIYNQPPTVVLNSPDDGAQTIITTPQLLFTGTDPEGNNLEYNVKIIGSGAGEFNSNSLLSSSNTLGYYRLESNVNDSKDSHNGTAGSGISYGAGKFGNQAISDGSGNGYLNLTNTSDYNFTTGDFTIAFWLTQNSPNAWSLIFCRGFYRADGYYFQYTSAGNAMFCSNQSGANQLVDATNLNLTDGVPKHIMVIKSGTTLNIYGDNSLTNTSTGRTITNPSTSTRSLEFFRYADGSMPFHGSVDDIVIMNKALSSTERDSFYQSVLADKYSSTDAGFTAGHPFSSGSQISYTVQDALPTGSYSWLVRATDPTGSGIYGDWATARTLTIVPSANNSVKANMATASTEQIQDNSVGSNIYSTYSKDSSVKTSITTTGQIAQYAIANISASSTYDNGVKTNIVITGIYENSSIASVVVISEISSSSKANIFAIVSNGLSVKTSIVVTNTFNQSTVANIFSYGEYGGSVKASIAVTNEYGNNSKASVVTLNAYDVQSKADIYATIEKVNSSIASIVTLGQTYNYAKANIYAVSTHNADTKASIVVTSIYENSAKALIVIYQSFGSSTKSNIVVTVRQTVTVCTVATYPTNAASEAPGTVSWNNTNQVYAEDGSVSSTPNFNSVATNRFLRSYAYGFAIPLGATITGILAEIKKATSSDTHKTDKTVQLYSNGYLGSNYKSATGWSSTLTWASYGGTTDTWGRTWTATEINDATFGVGIQAQADSTSCNAQVDAFRITVCYTALGGDSSTTNILVKDNTVGSSSKASIVVTVLQLSYATGNILAPVSQDNSSKASIVVTNTYGQSAKSSLVATVSVGNSATTDILTTYTKDNNVVASIVTAGQSAVSSKANIRRNNETKDNSVKSSIVVTNTANNSAKSSIVTTVSTNNNVKADIKVTLTDNNNVKTDILKTGNTQNNNSKASIVVTNSYANSVRAYTLPYWLAEIFTVNIGSVVSGNLESTYVEDSNRLVLSENQGAGPAFDYEFQFFHVDDANHQLSFTGYYTGNAGHNIKVQQWNFTLGQWEDVTTNTTDFPNAATDQHYNWRLKTPYTNYLSGGEVRVKIVHTSAGNVAHQLLINLLRLEDITIFDHSVKANIKATITQDNNIKADIFKSISTDNSAKASIVVTNSKANSAKADLVATTTQNNNVKANILKTGVTNDNSVKTDVVHTYTNDNSAKASLVVTNTKDVSVKSDIKATYTKENSSIGSLVNSGQMPVSSKANILRINNIDDSSTKASIVVTNTYAVSSKTSISGVITQSAKASIKQTVISANSSKSNILSVTGGANSVKASILVTVSKDVSTKVSIVTIPFVAQSAKASIVQKNIANGSNAKASIVSSTAYSNSTKASIVVTNMDGSSVKTDILSSITKINNAIASIMTADNYPVYSKVNIFVAGNTSVNSVKSSIVKTNSVGQSSKASISGVTHQDQSSKADIYATSSYNNNTKADIYKTNEFAVNVKASINSTSTYVLNTKADILSSSAYDSYVVANVELLFTVDTSAKASIVRTEQYNNSVGAWLESIVEEGCYSKANILRINESQYNVAKGSIVTSNLYSENYTKAMIYLWIVYRARPYQTRTSPIHRPRGPIYTPKSPVTDRLKILKPYTNMPSD